MLVSLHNRKNGLGVRLGFFVAVVVVAAAVVFAFKEIIDLFTIRQVASPLPKPQFPHLSCGHNQST